MRKYVNPLKWSWKLKVASIALLLLAMYMAKPIYSVIRWKTYIWIPSYIASTNPDPEIPDDRKHLIFVMVDHYEHGGPKHLERGARNNDTWCDKFQVISDQNRDDYGNRFRYTWFYPYDHHNDAIMQRLSDMAYEGYGEIEMHWHLISKSGVTKENYAEKLQEAIQWYQAFGAMISAGEDSRTAFAYVAGSWDLDASRPGPKSHGITNQIQELFKHGCYADFTFSTIDTPAQPAKVNSIYYVTDDPNRPKSHNDGIDARVGKPIDDKLMIFQGPMSIQWNGRGLDYGAVESDPRFRPDRVDKWIDTNIHVLGRPEWVFVKVYSHGAQSAEVVLDHDMAIMLETLKKRCKQRGIKLHYMTAREAYNVVKAAEDGETGNPEDYRDYRIPKPRNMVTPPGKVAPLDRVNLEKQSN